MTLRVFSSGKLDFEVNEKRMYYRLLGVLREQLGDRDEKYYLVVDHIVGNNQIDLLVIKKNAVISIDMKAFSGRIMGEENGTWSCEDSGKEKKESIQAMQRPEVCSNKVPEQEAASCRLSVQQSEFRPHKLRRMFHSWLKFRREPDRHNEPVVVFCH